MPRSSLLVALIALVSTYAFFYEYRPPFRQVHIPYDLPGYHYPLAGYAFESIKAGRWPQWDPTVYSGMDFTANVQAALFYPGTWLMFLGNWNRDRLSFQALQDQTLVHVWVAFMLFYFWMRGKKLHDLASILGAAVYAFSGYLCLQLQHFGLVAAYTWFPLALLGIDQIVAQGRWRPLWKVVAASALIFFAGYPPMWVVFAIVTGVYALARPRGWKIAPAVAAALAVSLLLCAVQILPTRALTEFRTPEAHYGSGYKDPMFYLSYVSPNYYNFGPKVPVETNPGKEYLYLGAPGLAGLALAFVALRRRAREVAPAFAVLGVSLILLMNPFDLVWNTVRHVDLLYDVVRDWYYLSGVTLGVAALTAHGLNAFLSRPGSPRSPWLQRGAMFLMGTWAMIELLRWTNDAFPYGPAALIDPAITLAIFALGLYAFRAQQGELRIWAGAALLICAGVDYKVFGTSKRFDADTGPGPRYEAHHFTAMSDVTLALMKANNTYRVLLEEFAPQPSEFRFLGLLIPQGADPFFSKQYRDFVKRNGTFVTDREFHIDPANIEALRVLGVRYVITAERGSRYQQLENDPRFRFAGPNDNYYKIYEYTDFRPPYGLDWPGEAGLQSWQPERRVFTVDSTAGGPFTFSEQFFPGWSATIDGRPATIERWSGAFQSVQVPGGRHRVEFQYRTPYLKLGAGISLCTFLGLVMWGLSTPLRSRLRGSATEPRA